MAIDPSKVERYRKVQARAEDPSSAEAERKAARRVCANMRKRYPGIERAAAGGSGEGGADTPFASDSWPTAEQRSQSFQDTWKDKLRDWFTDTVEQVSRGLSVVEIIDEDVAVEITSNTRTIHVKVKIPWESAEEVADQMGGSLEEYARLVGLRVGRDLAEAFESLDY